MKLSKHAKVRMQQRCIPRVVVDWLAAYGEVDHQRGAELFYFNEKARRALRKDLGRRALRGYSKSLNTYMVCTAGTIATVGHLHRRVVRH